VCSTASTSSSALCCPSWADAPLAAAPRRRGMRPPPVRGDLRPDPDGDILAVTVTTSSPRGAWMTVVHHRLHHPGRRTEPPPLQRCNRCFAGPTPFSHDDARHGGPNPPALQPTSPRPYPGGRQYRHRHAYPAGVRKLFPDHFTNFVFIRIGEVDSDTFRTPANWIRCASVWMNPWRSSSTTASAATCRRLPLAACRRYHRRTHYPADQVLKQFTTAGLRFTARLQERAF